MKLTDDEVLARLRASFQETAARTPIGDGRLGELTTTPLAKDRRTLVAAFSAAAAVAVIAGTGVVMANVGTGGSVSPVSGGFPAPTAACTPQNSYVTASVQELAGMTYLLSSPPPGYQLYGAWGTIDRSGCAGTTNWYVEYNKVVDGHDTTSIQLQVTTATARTPTGEALRSELGDLAPQRVPSLGPATAAAASSAAAQLGSAEAAASAAASAAGASAETSSVSPSAGASQAPAQPGEPAATPGWETATVAGHPARFIAAKTGGTGTLIWTDNALLFQLNAPVVGNNPGEIVKLAELLILVSPTDPGIQPPASCRVPAGWVCTDGRA